MQKDLMVKDFEWTIFDSSFGTMGLVFNSNKLIRVHLPDFTKESFLESMAETYSTETFTKKLPSFVKLCRQSILSYSKGKQNSLPELPLDWSQVSPFTLKVLKYVKRIPHGTLITYKDIAWKLRNPQASRAVGRAVGCNPFPLIVPCHRVVGSNGKLCGFTSSKGIEMKKELLMKEGIFF